MRAKGLITFAAAWLLVGAAAPLLAQSLADVAKKEEERRKQTTPAKKVYTNKDLGAVPPATAVPATSSSAGTASPADSKDAAKAEAGDKAAADDKSAAKKDAPPSGVKDQKYWSGRMKAAQEAASRDQTLADAMQSRINALTTDFVNRDDPAQRINIERDRQRALAELDRLKKQIIEDKKAIADLEEEARRAGVPAGWLR